jgi:hypothetical protein
MNQNEKHKARTPGRLAYERDLAAKPIYDDGAPRRSWDQLCDVAKDSWERNPTDRKTRGTTPTTVQA